MRGILLVLSLLGCAQALAQNETTCTDSVLSRTYYSDNGRRIQVTSLGNVIAFESPGAFEHFGERKREGYLIGYVDGGTHRIVYDLGEDPSIPRVPGNRSKTIVAGLSDLVPYCFEAPPHGTRFAFGKEVKVVAQVDTRDKALRLTHTITWPAGSGTITFRTVLHNLRSYDIQLKGYKRFVGAHVDCCGDWGTNTWLGNWTVSGTSVDNWSMCGPTGYCPPPPWTFTRALAATHIITSSGAGVTAVALRKSTDFVELTSPYPVTTGRLTGTRYMEDNWVALNWTFNAWLHYNDTRTVTSYLRQN